MALALKIFAGLAVAAALSSSAHAQGLINEKNLSLGMAQAIANGAMDKCEEMGFRISVAVVDRDGLPIVMLRGDGAGLHTPEGADRKAYTARTFRAPSARRRAADQSRRRRGWGGRRVRIARQG